MKIEYDKTKKQWSFTDATILTDGRPYGIEVHGNSEKVGIGSVIVVNGKLRAPNRREKTLMRLRLLPRMDHVLTPDNNVKAGICLASDTILMRDS